MTESRKAFHEWFNSYSHPPGMMEFTRDAWEAGAAWEREQCALIAEENADRRGSLTARTLASEIRARGKEQGQ